MTDLRSDSYRPNYPILPQIYGRLKSAKFGLNLAYEVFWFQNEATRPKSETHVR